MVISLKIIYVYFAKKLVFDIYKFDLGLQKFKCLFDTDKVQTVLCCSLLIYKKVSYHWKYLGLDSQRGEKQLQRKPPMPGNSHQKCQL